jgi:hypothetical protein
LASAQPLSSGEPQPSLPQPFPSALRTGHVAQRLFWLVPMHSWFDAPVRLAKDRFNSENEARKTLATMLGAFMVLGGAYFTWRNIKLVQEGQITDRFTKAIEQLGAVDASGKKKLEVRLSGIYALERIANPSHSRSRLTSTSRETCKGRPIDLSLSAKPCLRQLSQLRNCPSPRTNRQRTWCAFREAMLAFGGDGRAVGMADNKTKPTKLSVAAVIDALTDPTRRADAKALVKLMQRATGEKPKMWGPSIIGFGSYHYTYDSGREGDMPLICFSPRKAATVLYNMTGFSHSEALLAKLGKHTTGKGCLYIKTLSDVDQQVLEALVVKSVGRYFRVKHYQVSSNLK